MSIMDDILFALLVAAAFAIGYLFVWRFSGVLTDSFRTTTRSSLHNQQERKKTTGSDKTV